jgi:DNA polymerase I
LFVVRIPMAKSRSLEELRVIVPVAREIREKYILELEDADVRELAIHRRVSRMNYSRRCAEASAVQAYQKRGIPLATGMEIGYVVTDAAKWEVDTERDALEFDTAYYGKLLKKAWDEVAFILQQARWNSHEKEASQCAIRSPLGAN